MDQGKIKIGMELESRCCTGGVWYPVKVLRVVPNNPNLIWVRIAYPDKTTAEGLRYPNELRMPSTGETDESQQAG